MENLSMTQILEELKEARENALCDLRSEWIKDDARIELQIQMNLLNQSISSIETMMLNPNSQMFAGAISFS